MRVTACGGRWRPWALGGLIATLAACGATSRNPKGDGGTGGSAGTAGTWSDPGGEAGSPSELTSVPSYMRRLSKTEYVATVEDVLGARTDPSLPRIAAQGFDNNGEALGVGPADFEMFLATADDTAKKVLAAPELASRVLLCNEADDAACVRRIATELGLRLFRRPITDAELPAYEKVYATARTNGETHEDAVRFMLVAFLSSAQFLFRMELESGEQGPRRLDGYELATRLSYLLWSSAPDQTLLDAAAGDELADDAGLEAQFERLTGDDRFDRFDQGFGAQWLGLYRLMDLPRDAELYPEWGHRVQQAAVDEGVSYFRQYSQGGTPFSVFFGGKPRDVSSLLAPLYGVPAPSDAAATIRIDDTSRTGILASVAFLATTSPGPVRTSPTFRGRFILDQFLCAPPPPPPPDIDFGDLGPTPNTIRELLERVWANPRCNSCHQQMDPLGIALEHYDGIGRYRAQYDGGFAIDSTAVLPATQEHPEPVTAEQPSDVAAWLMTDPRIFSCFAQQVYAYGMGRMLREPDRRNIEQLNGAWLQSSLDVREALRALVMSETFRTRLDGASEEAL